MYLTELVELTAAALQSQSWLMKAQAAASMSTIATKLDASLGPPHLGLLLIALTDGLTGRTWSGKVGIPVPFALFNLFYFLLIIPGYAKHRDLYKSNLAISLKIRVCNSCVLPAMTYGAETWTLSKQAQNKLAAAQTKMERRIRLTSHTGTERPTCGRGQKSFTSSAM